MKFSEAGLRLLASIVNKFSDLSNDDLVRLVLEVTKLVNEELERRRAS